MALRIPLFGIYQTVCDLRDRLKDKSLWREPAIFDDVSERDLVDFQDSLAAETAGGRPLRVGYTFPQAETELPGVTCMLDSWGTAEAVLNEWAGNTQRTVTEDTEVLAAGAVGGETVFPLRHYRIVPHSQTVSLNGSSDGYISEVDYSIDWDTGTLTLQTPLSPGDTLSIVYMYYDAENPKSEFGEISEQTARVFIMGNNAAQLLMLSALVWREFVLQRNTLETAHGIKNLAMHFESLSDWAEVLPTFALHQELVLTYQVEQTAQIAMGPQPTRFELDVQTGQSPAAVATLELGISGETGDGS